MLAGTLNKGYRIDGYVVKGLVDPRLARQRHDDIVVEMERRGYNHQSPLPEFPTPPGHLLPLAESHKELLRRCEECRSYLKNTG